MEERQLPLEPPKSYLDLLPSSVRENLVAPLVVMQNYQDKMEEREKAAQAEDRVSRGLRSGYYLGRRDLGLHQLGLRTHPHLARVGNIYRRQRATDAAHEKALWAAPRDRPYKRMAADTPEERKRIAEEIEDQLPLDLYPKYKYVRGDPK